MADLDTRSKRASSVNFLKPYALDLVLPDGAIGQGDRQHTIWDYSGILAIAPVVVVIEIICAGATVSLVTTTTEAVTMVTTTTSTVTGCD